MILESPRLRFRRLMLEDVDALAEMYADPEMRRYFPEGTLSYDETREEVEWFLDGHPRHPELGLWATIEKATGDFIGRCGLLPWELNGQHEVEIAFLIARSRWGQGLATEAAAAIRDYAVTQLGLTRLVCLIEPGNLASVRVAEKIGMVFERADEDDKGPYWLYSLETERLMSFQRDTQKPKETSMALPITLYGTLDCDDTERSRAYLTQHAIPFTEVDIAADEAAEQFVIFINGGNRSTPTIVFGDGNQKVVLTEPSDAELEELLRQSGYR